MLSVFNSKRHYGEYRYYVSFSCAGCHCELWRYADQMVIMLSKEHQRKGRLGTVFLIKVVRFCRKANNV
jgi:hypothetical protein